MITISKKLDSIKLLTNDFFPDENCLFFDIETTGFSPKTNIVYLIGCVFYHDNQFHIMQWLAENEKEENIILLSFYKFSSNFSKIIHYNGNGFDIPFLQEKSKQNQIPLSFSQFENIDIYKKIQPYKKHLKLENLKQKTLEKFLDINRTDVKNGGELISVYWEFSKTGSEQLKSLLLLHNEDDVIGMIQLVPIFAYPLLFNGNIINPLFELHEYKSSDGEKKQEAIFSFDINAALPKRISCSQNDIYMTAHKNSGKIKITICNQELKYFFPNYKDYYYLPVEDTSIHKSVAFYVDKNFRTRAKAANCYSKKTGIFLPQHETIVTPYFKRDYNDKSTFFEITDEFSNDTNLQLKYIQHLLKCL